MTQLFQDTETGEFWEFDDDVRVDSSQGYYEFMAPRGGRIDVPKTLAPAIRPAVPAAPEYVPVVVSRFQGRQALRLSTIEGGHVVINDTSAPNEEKRDLLAAVEELLARATTPAYYREAWNDIQQFERDSPMLNAIADELGLTAANLDDLFIFGKTLRA
ncbi:hypothetical protein ACOTFF_15740 [Achromobacter xylosoxidans]